MLRDFLLKNEEEILALTEKKTLDLAGARPSSDQLKQGLPMFFKQLLNVLVNEDVPAMARAAGTPEEAEIALSAGRHGTELLRLGYTLSHVVHAYGAMCQAITELAAKKKAHITAPEFHGLNLCLDIAIAGAVTQYQTLRDIQEADREVKHLGVLAHELRNALTSASLALRLVKKGSVGLESNTGRVLENSLKRAEVLIERSLTEVRLRVDPEVHAESFNLLQVVNQILTTSEVEAQARNQTLEIKIDPTLILVADQQAVHSALSNLIQNALKYTRVGGKIQVRGQSVGDAIEIEVEDECGGLLSSAEDLFKPFVQKNENKKGLGLGLTIAKRAIELNHGTIEARNLKGKGCIFKITLPTKNEAKSLGVKPYRSTEPHQSP